MTLYVNGENIDASLIAAEVERMRPGYQQMFGDQPETEQNTRLAEWARENLIEQVIFRQQAARAFPTISPGEVQAALEGLLNHEDEMGPLHQQMAAGADQQAVVRRHIITQLQQEKLSRQLTEMIGEPSEKEIRRFYEANRASRFTVPQMVHAAHIVKHPGPETTPERMQADMQAILDQLDSGVPFEQLAREQSDCPDKAGDLGFFARGQMVPVFEDIVFALRPGAHSGIFETEFGLHIAKVYEIRDAVPCSLEQVRGVIAKELRQQAGEKAIEQFLDAQKEKAVIEQR